MGTRVTLQRGTQAEDVWGETIRLERDVHVRNVYGRRVEVERDAYVAGDLLYVEELRGDLGSACFDHPPRKTGDLPPAPL